jgi:hypothetical protein
VLRLAKVAQIPADSPLGRKTDRTTSLAELKVSEIIPVAGLGRFSLQPLQTAPRNAYVAASVLQEALEQPDKANAIFVAGKTAAAPPPDAAASAALQSALHPTLEDYGLALKHVRRTFEQGGKEEVIFDYFSLSSDRMLLDAATERVAPRAFAKQHAAPVLTFLANEIGKVWPTPARENDPAGHAGRCWPANRSCTSSCRTSSSRSGVPQDRGASARDLPRPAGVAPVPRDHLPGPLPRRKRRPEQDVDQEAPHRTATAQTPAQPDGAHAALRGAGPAAA